MADALAGEQGGNNRRRGRGNGLLDARVQEMVRRYNREGDATVTDGRHANPGAAPLLNAAQWQALDAALDAPPPDGGMWDGPKVAAWMAATLGQTVAAQRGW